MYPRNAASPPRIAIGAVVQISDGAVQSSGVSVVVRPEGGAESAGAGTIAYSAASGVVYYTPTQAETNYTAFCVIAYKTACIPAQVTVVPSASSTAGVAELDSATITSIQSGLATQATLLLVKAQTDLIGSAAGATTVLAAAVLTPGTITEFPDTLTIGDSYTTANGRSIQIPIVDTDGNQISSTGSLDFADATATFVIKRAKETDSTRIITGTAAFTDPVGTGTSGAPYAVVQLTSSETAKGLIGYKYSGVLTFTWPYVGTGTDPEVMSFETDTLNFDN
jgi:hypothetical protein